MVDRELRKAIPADAPAIRAVARESWHAAYDDFLGSETVDAVIDDWYAVDGLRRSIRADNQHVFVAPESVGRSQAADASPLAGFVHVGPWPDEPGVAQLARLYVRSSRWGEGIGRRLLERAETALEDDGYDRVRLEAFAENDVGVGFYRKAGFERVGEQEEPFRGETHVVISFEKPIE